MADEQIDAIKKQLAADREARDRSFADYQERMKGKPTPTQEENDRAVLGEHVAQKEDDGSGPDPEACEQLPVKLKQSARPAATKPAPHGQR